MAKKKAAMGRGLGALISEQQYKPNIGESKEENLNEIAISNIQTNPYQPRTEFDKEALDELATSIKELGIIQPITVRRVDDKFQLISGERRFRASQIAGLTKIPAFVREVNDQAMLEMALVENIQRENLNAIEIAISYQRLIDECSLTQERMSDRVGKKRATISNYLRLLKLPAEAQIAVRDKKISMGHARTLVTIHDGEVQVKALFRIINENLSVRQTEDMVRKLNNPVEHVEVAPETPVTPEQFSSFSNKLGATLESKVQLKRNAKGKGSIVIPFATDEELEALIAKLNKVTE